MKKTLSLLSVIILTTACTPAQPSPAEGEAKNEKLIVTTSFYPLTHFAQQVGGDLIDVRQIASAGADPHSFEPNPQQVKQIFESDLFLYNGGGQDPYADRLHEELVQNDMKVLVISELVDRMPYEQKEHVHHEEDHKDEHDEEEDHEDEHEEEDHDDHEEGHEDHEEGHDEHDEDGHDDHNHGEWDPHVWLDPHLAQDIVQVITEALSESNPSLAGQFQANADAYIAQLQSLDADMQAGLSGCALDAIIVSHDAYRYLANRYDFHTFEIAGLSPSMEPSPARLAELTEIAAEEGIGHVFFETQVSPALSQTLAQEIGAQTLTLHSIEALTEKERSEGMTYIDLQRGNLKNLRTALKCS